MTTRAIEPRPTGWFARATLVSAFWACVGASLCEAANASQSAPASDPTRAFLEERVRSDPDDSTAWNRLGALALAELRRGGDFAALKRAEQAATESLGAVPVGENPGGLALRAQAAQAAHRFAAARDDAALLTRLAPGRADGWRMLAEANLELGEIVAAERAEAEARRIEPEVIATELLRARLALAKGERAEAARRLDGARSRAEAMTPPLAEVIAWCRVRRGQLAFSAGDLATAEASHRAALDAWPGWYVAEDHLAETLAARGDFSTALKIYRGLAERMRRPELWQAFGDTLLAAGETEEAAEWHARAKAGYLASAEAGEALYVHHLAAFYCDVRADPAEAVRWARRDLETRKTMAGWDALGWALHLAGRHAEALEAESRALAAPAAAQDAHVLSHAAAIFKAAGETARGRKFLKMAAAANPRGGGFHVHR